MSIGAFASEELGHQRTKLVTEEAKAFDRLLVADAEPQRPAGALVERRVGTGARGLVEHDPYRHRRRADPGHRAHVTVLVARGEGNVSPGQHRPRLINRPRPPLEHARRDQRPPLRVTDPLPLDRGPRVQQDPPRGQDREHLAGRSYRDRARLRSLDPVDDLLIGTRDRLPVHTPQTLQRAHDFAIAARRRTPLDVDHRRPLGLDRVGERRQADVDRSQTC